MDRHPSLLKFTPIARNKEVSGSGIYEHVKTEARHLSSDAFVHGQTSTMGDIFVPELDKNFHFPIDSRDLQILMSACEVPPNQAPTPFMCQQSTPSLRMLAHRFVVLNSHLSATTSDAAFPYRGHILKPASIALAPGARFIVRPQKLEIHRKGCYFPPTKKASRKGGGCFAYLQVILPSRFEGGDLIVRKNGKENVFKGGDSTRSDIESCDAHMTVLLSEIEEAIERGQAIIATNLSNQTTYMEDRKALLQNKLKTPWGFSCHWVAYHADSKLELRPVTLGTRVSLTYQLYIDPQFKVQRPLTDQDNKIAAHIREMIHIEEKHVGILLERQYDMEPHHFPGCLHENDKLMYRLLAAGIPRSRMYIEQVVITAAGKPHREFDEEHTEWFDFDVELNEDSKLWHPDADDELAVEMWAQQRAHQHRQHHAAAGSNAHDEDDDVEVVQMPKKRKSQSSSSSSSSSPAAAIVHPTSSSSSSLSSSSSSHSHPRVHPMAQAGVKVSPVQKKRKSESSVSSSSSSRHVAAASSPSVVSSPQIPSSSSSSSSAKRQSAFSIPSPRRSVSSSSSSTPSAASKPNEDAASIGKCLPQTPTVFMSNGRTPTAKCDVVGSSSSSGSTSTAPTQENFVLKAEHSAASSRSPALHQPGVNGAHVNGAVAVATVNSVKKDSSSSVSNKEYAEVSTSSASSSSSRPHVSTATSNGDRRTSIPQPLPLSSPKGIEDESEMTDVVAAADNHSTSSRNAPSSLSRKRSLAELSDAKAHSNDDEHVNKRRHSPTATDVSQSSPSSSSSSSSTMNGNTTSKMNDREEKQVQSTPMSDSSMSVAASSGSARTSGSSSSHMAATIERTDESSSSSSSKSSSTSTSSSSSNSNSSSSSSSSSMKSGKKEMVMIDDEDEDDDGSFGPPQASSLYYHLGEIEEPFQLYGAEEINWINVENYAHWMCYAGEGEKVDRVTRDAHKKKSKVVEQTFRTTALIIRGN